MKRHTLRAALALPLLAALTLLLAAACEKEPVNSDVEGFWRLERFVTKADGATTRPERLFVSIQLWVVRLGNLASGSTPGDSDGAGDRDPSGAGTFTGRYACDEENNTVRMWDFFAAPDGSLTEEEKQALEEENLARLAPYGIGALDTTFRIVQAGGHRLVLESDYATLYLTRF